MKRDNKSRCDVHIIKIYILLVSLKIATELFHMKKISYPLQAM